MTYDDAQQFMHIAENAYRVGAYTEALEVLTRLAHYVKRGEGMTPEQCTTLTRRVRNSIAEFSTCPDECAWEMACELTSLFE